MAQYFGQQLFGSNYKRICIYLLNMYSVAKCSPDVINIAGDDINRERVIRYLGAFLDEYLTFKDHI